MRNCIDNNTDLSNFKSEIKYPIDDSTGIGDQTVENTIDLRVYPFGNYGLQFNPNWTQSSFHINQSNFMFQVINSGLTMPAHSFPSPGQRLFIMGNINNSSDKTADNESHNLDSDKSGLG